MMCSREDDGQYNGQPLLALFTKTKTIMVYKISSCRDFKSIFGYICGQKFQCSGAIFITFVLQSGNLVPFSSLSFSFWVSYHDGYF